MLLFIVSNAIYPIDSMPSWVGVNALSYEVDAPRSLMVQGGRTVFR
jgi:hypothetical protein